MEQIKKLGDTCRKHYEKLILVFVLLLLAGVVFYLAKASEDETKKLEEMKKELKSRSVKGVPPVDLSHLDEGVRQMTNPPALNYSGPHNLLNPVKWQRDRAGGELTKVKTGKEAGLGNLQIVRIRPLNLSVGFGRASTSTQNDQTTVIGYQLYITNELTLVGNRPRTIPVFAAAGETNKPLILVEVKGPPEAPTEMSVLLKDYGNERVTIAPGRPHLRPIGFDAELKYPFGNKSYSNVRVGQTLEIDGEPYKIVDITQTKVVLFDDSNGKRYNIEQIATP